MRGRVEKYLSELQRGNRKTTPSQGLNAMLYVETDKDGDQVFLHADQEGIQKLRELLDVLDSQPEAPEHDHLLTPVWGGYGLDEKLEVGSRDGNSDENRTVHHLKMYYWPKPKA
jgi:hypothetical protein